MSFVIPKGAVGRRAIAADDDRLLSAGWTWHRLNFSHATQRGACENISMLAVADVSTKSDRDSRRPSRTENPDRTLAGGDRCCCAQAAIRDTPQECGDSDRVNTKFTPLREKFTAATASCFRTG